MEHKDGYCDGCGCEVTWPGAQLTSDGRELCWECVAGAGDKTTVARRPEARDDGR